MARLPRLIADGLIYHALNRGNNRAAVFLDARDFLTFLLALRQTKERYPFRLFGYCLMGNHFHLLLQPEERQSISRILQSLTVAHTWHYHRRYHGSGHVWQGRFKSPIIQDDEHLLTVLRYVEGNALRANMVADLAAYPWSSYIVHGLGKRQELVDELPGWQGLGKTETERQAYWRTWLHTPLSGRELEGVRRAITSGRPFGAEGWVEGTAKAVGLNLMVRPRGRPRKSIK
jgi:REP-associated tyrosine transposase